ncbi:MAG: hypothetical protein IJD57_05545 [Candidatus Gastranaerophilales bacterium]|nr:hypothetical protein [Candidatus Gastranaerophilales bacterium]
MSSSNLIKNITSKDLNLSLNTIKTLINTSNLEDFGELCEKSDFIFPFLKKRITDDFVKLINKENLNAVFEFSKIYCEDFEDLIVKSWVKFACEDLTDKILELFENGTNEQKAYCASYFKYIQDPLALEYLNEFAKSDFEALMLNCAKTLSVFKDETILNEMKNVIKTQDDEFEKLSAFNFICAYNGEENIKFVVQNAFSSPFLSNILSNLMDFCGIEYLKTILGEDDLIKIFQTIIEKYPEEISIDTAYYWNFIDYINLIYSFNNQYSKNVLILAREKFKEYSTNDIYLFDFDKNTKEEIKNIAKLLNSLDLTFKLNENYDNMQLSACLSVIKELKLVEYCDFLIDLLNNANEEKTAQIVLVLKKLEKTNLINHEIIENMQNENLKAFCLSLI